MAGSSSRARHTPAAALLLNRLGTLRYHRADAHAAAWAEAGHTAASIQALGPGPARDAIEERLLADLAQLPG